MQSDGKAKMFFKKILNQQEINSLCTQNSSQLTSLAKETGLLFFRKIKKKPHQVMNFLSNYHDLIVNISEASITKFINNLSLHFINLSSYALIQNGQKAEARSILKKSYDYIDSTDPDPTLLSTALNNLCILTKENGKYYKALHCALSSMQIMQSHIKNLKSQKQENKKSYVIEDSVLLINSYLLVCSCSKGIMNQNNNRFYKQLFINASQKGYKKSVKYLGQESYFSKRFKAYIKTKKTFNLPIYKSTPEEQQSVINEDKAILSKLNQIQILLNQRKQPQVVYVQPPPQVVQKQKIEKVPQPQPIKNYERKQIFNISIKGWQVEVKLLFEKGQQIANTVFECMKGGQRINLVISSQKMIKILRQMNLADVLPYDCSIKNIQSYQFIKYCILCFFDIDDTNKNIQLFPRSPGLLEPFLFKIMKKDHIIFLNHINYNNYRLSLCPLKTSDTMHLEIEFKKKFIEEILSTPIRKNKNMVRIYNELMEVNRKKNRISTQDPSEKIVIKQKQRLQTILQNILQKFDHFLQEQIEQNIQKQIEFDSFYKFAQGNHDDEGKFFYIRSLRNLKGFDIYIKSSQKSHCPGGNLTIAKGNVFYNSFQFLRDFGISISQKRSKMKCFAQIICRKYNLKQFQKTLSTRDEEIYAQNAIKQVKIAFKTYSRKMISFQNFMKPITACVVSINSCIPVGIRLTGYDPINCEEKGFFIHVNPIEWEWVNQDDAREVNDPKTLVEQYSYKKEYFLVEWLERFGFEALLSILNVDKEGNFYIKGHNFFFNRIANLIDTITKME